MVKVDLKKYVFFYFDNDHFLFIFFISFIFNVKFVSAMCSNARTIECLFSSFLEAVRDQRADSISKYC